MQEQFCCLCEAYCLRYVWLFTFGSNVLAGTIYLSILSIVDPLLRLHMHNQIHHHF